MLMNKKFLSVLVLLLIIGFVSADSISSYEVDSSVPLDRYISATGIYNSDSNVGILCSFYFFDVGTGVLVNRATDQYTTTTGRFTMPSFPINEPKFKRDSNYILTTECGTASSSSSFLVNQRETIAFYGQQEFDFATDQGNTDTVFIWGVLILILIGILFSGKKLMNFAGGK